MVLAACFAVTPGATLLTPRAVAGSVPAGPPGGRGGSALTSAAAPQGAQARLSVVDWNAYDERDTDGPGTYSFGYEIEDPSSGNTQFRQEERFANGTVVGSYGLVEPDGNVRVVSYVADALGYRVRIENSLRKSENFPRTTTTTTSTGRPRRPEWSTSDRLLGGTVPQASAVEVFRRQQQQQQLEQLPPLQWAVQSLQDGRRAPVQEQRLRPASAPRRYASEMEMEYVAQQQQQQLQQQQQQQQQQYLQEQQQLQQKRLQQQQHHLQEQQQQQPQQQQQRLDRGVGQVYAPVEQQQQYGLSSMPVQYEDVSNSLAPEVEYYRREEAVDNRRSSGEWSSKPIVVRRQLPPIPLLDKLIYQ